MKASKKHFLNRFIVTAIFILLACFSQRSYALSSREVCERSAFKLWKAQQGERLWSPSAETLEAEATGKIFNYNCFSSKEIDSFFQFQGDRIENAHFHPILLNQSSVTENKADDNDDCS